MWRSIAATAGTIVHLMAIGCLPTFANAGCTFVVPGMIQAEEYCGAQGIQLENTTDSGGGQNINALDSGDWTEYDIDVATGGLYTFQARVASQGGSGQMEVRLSESTAHLASISVPDTGGWQSWTTISTTVELSSGFYRLRLDFPVGINLNWVSFSSGTESPSNHPTISQAGCAASSSFDIPGLIQAEDYCDKQGVLFETTSDAGGGNHVVFLDTDDFTEYNVQVATSGVYTFDARVASQGVGGQMVVRLGKGAAPLAWLSIPSSRNWQGWGTFSKSLNLDAGLHTLRLDVSSGGMFNLNWVSFTLDQSSEPSTSPTATTLSPTKAPTPSPSEIPTNPPSNQVTKAPQPILLPTPPPINTCTDIALPGYLIPSQYCEQQGITFDGSNITQIENGGYVEYNINVGSSRQHTFTANVYSCVYSGHINVQVNGISALWLSVPNTNYAYKTISGNFMLNAGTHKLRIAFPQGGFQARWFGIHSTTSVPTKYPTLHPSHFPTVMKPPSSLPTDNPTLHPVSPHPTEPSQMPTKSPSGQPTLLLSPTKAPYQYPSKAPTKSPSDQPTLAPQRTMQPTPPPTSACLSAPVITLPGYLLASQYCDQRGVIFDGSVITQIDNGDYVEYSVSIETSRQYTFAANVLSGVYSGHINVQVNEVSALWLPVPYTNGAYKTASANAWLNAGSHKIRIAFPQGGFKARWFGFDISTSTPTKYPTLSPTHFPTAMKFPSSLPTGNPSLSESYYPTAMKAPSSSPTVSPSLSPATPNPTKAPSIPPSKAPAKSPSNQPTMAPQPTVQPTPPPTSACLSAPTITLPGYLLASQYCDHRGVVFDGSDITQIDSGDYVEYNINVGSCRQYTFAANVLSGVYSGHINVQVNGVSALWLPVPHTNGAYKTVWANIELNAGTHRLRIAFPQGGFKARWFGFGSGTNNPPPNPPTSSGTLAPSKLPSSSPTLVIASPTYAPSSVPTAKPSQMPTPLSTYAPTPKPTPVPTPPPISIRTAVPIPSPTEPIDCTIASAIALPGYLLAGKYCGQQGITFNGSDITQIDNGDYVEYNINIGTSHQYTFAANILSGVYSGQINVQVNGVSVLWLSVPHTNNAYKNVWANVWLNAGTHRMRIAFPQGGFKVKWFGVEMGTNNPPAPLFV